LGGIVIEDGKPIPSDRNMRTVTSVEYNPTAKHWEITSKDDEGDQRILMRKTQFVHLEKLSTIEAKALELPFKTGDRIIAKKEDGKKGQIKEIKYVASGNFWAVIDLDDGSEVYSPLENFSPE